MTDENLSLTRRIQLKELEIIKVFQDICRRHGLRYFAIGGTCLGAVRHKGFIPWDDDVDFTMPWEDYVKFTGIAKTELPSNYALHGHRQPWQFGAAYALRLHDKNTAYLHLEQLNTPDLWMGIHIDLLIMNGLPTEPELKAILDKSERYWKLNESWRTFLMRLSAPSKALWKTIVKRILRVFERPAEIFLPTDYFISKLEKMLSKYAFDCSDKIMFPWRRPYPNEEGWYKKVFWYEDFKESVELQFEDTTIAVPAGYERYLTMDYGDYMTLPPKEKRHSAWPADIVDFDRPYTYYLEHPEAVKC